MQVLLDVILPVFLVIGFGYLSTWRGWFPVSGIDGLMAFTMNFAIPCLLFQAISNLDLSISFDPRLLFSFYTAAAACFGLGLLGARLLFRRDWEDCVAIGFCCLFSNSILLGLPITERAYGPEALSGNFAIVSFHAPFCYGLGIAAMELVRSPTARIFARRVGTAMFSNALVLAIVAGFAVNLMGMTLPSVIDDGLSMMARAALPAALFALGGVLIQYRPEGDMKTIAMVCAITLMAHPALVWLLGRATALPPDAFRSGVLTAAMAPGFNAYIFANMYGRAKRIAASSVLITTGGSILTVWVWLTLLG
ncbi:MAG: AEC family transporter [Pseudomonadota bacterium]